MANQPKDDTSTVGLPRTDKAWLDKAEKKAMSLSRAETALAEVSKIVAMFNFDVELMLLAN